MSKDRAKILPGKESIMYLITNRDEFMHRCSYMSKSIAIGSEIYVRDKIERFKDATHWRREHHPLQPEGVEDMHCLYLPSR